MASSSSTTPASRPERPDFEALKNLKESDIAALTAQTDALSSEFPNGKVAVGAAITFIDELKAALPEKKYGQILELFNSYYTHSLTEKDVYVLVKNVLRGVEGEEALLKGFERFMPADVAVGRNKVVGGGDLKGV